MDAHPTPLPTPSSPPPRKLRRRDPPPTTESNPTKRRRKHPDDDRAERRIEECPDAPAQISPSRDDSKATAEGEEVTGEWVGTFLEIRAAGEGISRAVAASSTRAPAVSTASAGQRKSGSFAGTRFPEGRSTSPTSCRAAGLAGSFCGRGLGKSQSTSAYPGAASAERPTETHAREFAPQTSLGARPWPTRRRRAPSWLRTRSPSA